MVDEQITKGQTGRLFSVVYLNDQQYKVTDGDLLQTNADLGVDIGSKISLDKVCIFFNCSHFFRLSNRENGWSHISEQSMIVT